MNKNLLYFLISLVVAVVLTWLVKEPGFTESQTFVLFLAIFSVGLWLTEAVPPYAVGLFIIAFLVFTLGYDRIADEPQDVKMYVNTFSSSVIWLLLGGFFLAAAMTRTKLDMELIQFTLRICGDKPDRILFGLMAVTMTVSLLISNTATTAMVVAAAMPLLTKLGKDSRVGKGLLLGIPLASVTGGIGTVIGTPPNPIAAEALAKAGEPIDFITWMFYGFPLSIVLTLIAWRVLVRIFMKDAAPLSTQNLLGQDDKKVNPLERRLVMIVVVITVLMWLSTPIHGLSAAAVSAIPLVVLTLTRILTAENIRAMGWDTLLLVAGGLSLGAGLQQTGLLDLYAGKIAAFNMPDVAFYLLMGYATMLFSNIMSSTATATVLISLGMAILPEHKTEIAMVIGLSASCGLFLPVSTPPNAIVYSTGLIEQKDLRIGGTLMGLLGPGLIVLWVLLIS